MQISNYQLIEKLAESPQAALYKACRKGEPERLLALKILKTQTLSEYRQLQFRQRIEHLRVLNHPLLGIPDSFGVKDGICFITREYFDGLPLSRLARSQGRPALNDFFTLALQLSRALEAVHQAGIIHGGVKPNNVLVHPGTLELRLVDFISALDVRDISHFIYEKSFVRDTLCYTSPEQSGRINHRVGFASDLYSLGVLCYELLTGRLPFSAEDPLELIHCHLAREAAPLHELNPEVPPVLSRLVARLLLKQPEKRYRGAAGLLEDLTRCRDQFTALGTVRDFPLERGLSGQSVTFISRMVGRDREAESILTQYERVASGEFRALFISGLSGIGKTRLIQELQQPIVRHRGYFSSGKFDVYQRNIPYSSLIQALRNLMRTFLTESDQRVAQWKGRILAGVGGNGRVLCDVIPELELLIGPQPGVRPLPPVESLNRFHDLFQRFLSALASAENPLTLFIDDLQWCDVASFDFLSNILEHHREHPHLYLLGAYRHNEVEPSHPLAQLIRRAGERGWPLSQIRLAPLEPGHCHEMVSYILDAPRSQTRALADFIAQLSEGNPLFVSESLSYLHNEGLLYLDPERQWRWDLNKISRSRMPTTVVALFSAKIEKLPFELVELLKYCACLGNSFSPSEIAAIRKLTLLECFVLLKPALRQGLLLEHRNQLQFIHDRVQEAVLASIPAQRRREIHRQVGNHLYAALPRQVELEQCEQLFSIVSHLNLGREEGQDRAASHLLSELNFHAGNKALQALATEAANDYYNLSRELLPADCWDEPQYQRSFRIYQMAAKTELMCGDYGKSERLLSQLLEHARSDLDKAECLAEQTTSLSSIGNFIQAIDTANRGLAYFGKAIPMEAGQAEARRGELMAGIAARGGEVWRSILEMPFTTERRSKIELAFYSELIPDLYMSGLVPQLYLAAAQSTRHCLEGGMDESVIYSFSIMGLQLGEQGDFEPAFRYEDLARELSARHPNTFGATRGMNGIVWCNMHSRSHPRQIVEYCLKGIQCGKNCGDLYNAGLCYGPLMWNLQLQGRDLSGVEEAARECLQFSQRYHLSFSVGLAEAVLAGWVEPMRQGCRPVPMEQKLERWERENHVASAGSYYVLRALAHYYLGEHAQAGRCLARVRRYLSGLTDNVLKRQWHVFLVLNALKLYERGEGERDLEALRAEVDPLMARIESWAALGPLLQPYLALARAELERVTGSPREARSLYLDALAQAQRQEYLFLEGYLYQALGELCLEQGLGSERLYFAEAARLYRRCRAQRMEQCLLERHPEGDGEEPEPAPLASPGAPPGATLPDLDLDYLTKSALAIAAATDREALPRRILQLVLESSGAQRGYLLIEEGGALVLRAESHAARQEPARALSLPLEQAGEICKAMVRYVHRTGERLILGNAAGEGEFRDNPEVQGLKLRSVLCLPLVRQSSRLGVLYLENRLAEAVFSAEKTRMTELLLLQAGLALENARLVAQAQEQGRRPAAS